MKLTKEQLFLFVAEERKRQKITEVDDWYLVALARVESGLIVGRISRRQTGSKNAYTKEEVLRYGIPGECQRRGGGLYQITPVAWQTYFAETKDGTSPMMLFDQTDFGAEYQTRVGLFCYRKALAAVRVRPAIVAASGSPQFAAWADAIYARGSGALDLAIARVQSLGLPVTLSRVLQALPDNGENTAFHGEVVAATARAYRAGTNPPSP